MLYDTDILKNIAMMLMPYDTDITGIILMLHDTEYSLSRSTISSFAHMVLVAVTGCQSNFMSIKLNEYHLPASLLDSHSPHLLKSLQLSS